MWFFVSPARLRAIPLQSQPRFAQKRWLKILIYRLRFYTFEFMLEIILEVNVENNLAKNLYLYIGYVDQGKTRNRHQGLQLILTKNLHK